MSFEDTMRQIVREELRAMVNEFKGALEPVRAAPAPAAELLTVEAIADRCHVTADTVRAWIHSGHLVAHKAGRRFLAAQPDLERFLAGESDRRAKITTDEHLRVLQGRLSRAGGK